MSRKTALALCAMVLSAMASPDERSHAQQPSVFLRGTVIDQQTNTPVMNVVIRIVDTPLSALTDADGRFYFHEIRRGDYTLRADHIAYAAAITKLEVRADDLDVEVRLSPEAIPIHGIIVTAFSRRLEAVGFYEREKRGIGTFIDRKQIEKMKVQSSSDLLRNVPGLRLVPQAARRNVPPNQMRGRGNCRFKYIVDGARTLSDFEIDFVAPYAIEGLEVYAGLSEVPAVFRANAMPDGGQTICGVIAIWTRDGP